MIYEYRCVHCCHDFEVSHGYNDNCEECPICGSESPERLISSTYGIVRHDPTTLKHLADRNTQKMGHYEREARTHQEKLRRKGGPSKAEELGYNIVKPDYERPFWRDDDKIDLDLAKLNEKQKMEYIKTGSKPSKDEIKQSLKAESAKKNDGTNGVERKGRKRKTGKTRSR